MHFRSEFELSEFPFDEFPKIKNFVESTPRTQFGETKDFFKKGKNNLYILLTSQVNNFFDEAPKEKFILISHNDDGSIINHEGRRGCKDCGQEYCANIEKIPENLIKWYGMNLTTNHPKIESLPIGIENERNDYNLKKCDIIHNFFGKENHYQNLLLVNHYSRHNPKEREEPCILLRDKKWVTHHCTRNSMNGINYESFLNELKSHKFILCPEGVGPDTHRIWESLYLGVIPIVKNKVFSQYYKDLPVCFVDNWSDISEEFLNIEYERIKNGVWNLNKIELDFWKEKIIQTINENE